MVRIIIWFCTTVELKSCWCHITANHGHGPLCDPSPHPHKYVSATNKTVRGWVRRGWVRGIPPPPPPPPCDTSVQPIKLEKLERLGPWLKCTPPPPFLMTYTCACVRVCMRVCVCVCLTVTATRVRSAGPHQVPRAARRVSAWTCSSTWWSWRTTAVLLWVLALNCALRLTVRCVCVVRTCHWLDFQRHPTLVITSPQRRHVTDQRAAGAFSVTVCSLPVTGQRAGGGVVSHSVFTACYRITGQRSGGGVVSHSVFTACYRSTGWRGRCQSRCVHCLLQINDLAGVLSVTLCSLPVTDQRSGGGVVSHAVFTACYRSTSWRGRATAVSHAVFTACYRSTSWRGRATAASPATTRGWRWTCTTTHAARSTSTSATPWGDWASTSTTTSTVSSTTAPTPTGDQGRVQPVSQAGGRSRWSSCLHGMQRPTWRASVCSHCQSHYS